MDKKTIFISRLNLSFLQNRKYWNRKQDCNSKNLKPEAVVISRCLGIKKETFWSQRNDLL
jgi:hypothetical protein